MQAGDFATAWAPAAEDGGIEWLQMGSCGVLAAQCAGAGTSRGNTGGGHAAATARVAVDRRGPGA
jgi:hypothetical protein